MFIQFLIELNELQSNKLNMKQNKLCIGSDKMNTKIIEEIGFYIEKNFVFFISK